MTIVDGYLKTLEEQVTRSPEMNQANRFSDLLEVVRYQLESRGDFSITADGIGGTELGDPIIISDYFGKSVEVNGPYAFVLHEYSGKQDMPDGATGRRLSHDRQYLAVLVHENGMEMATGKRRELPVESPNEDQPTVTHLDPTEYSRGDSWVNVLANLRGAISRVVPNAPQGSY